MELNTRRLEVADAAAVIALRREALETEPLAFRASPADDVGLLIDAVRSFLGEREMHAVFGQFDGATVTGMVALVKSAALKHAHKATVWGMYVQPHVRKLGVGRALLSAAIAQARAWRLDQLQL